MRLLFPFVLALGLACGGGDPVVSVAPSDEEPAAEAPDELAPSPPVARLRPSFPLTMGDRWTWQVTRHVGAGLRVLFMPTEPATTDVISTWELTIDRADPDGRFAATRTRTNTGALPQRTDLVLWLQDGDLWMVGPGGPEPALKLVVPPDAMATEKVPCIAVFLDGVPGFCSPAPGGPLDVPPGPVYGVVSADDDNGRTLAQFLVGVGTAGLLIPGNKTAQEILELVQWRPANPAGTSPAVERWRANPTPAKLPALLTGSVEREDAAAFVALASDADRVAVTRTTLAVLPIADRAALLRVTLSATTGDRLTPLAQLTEDLGGTPSPASVDALVALLNEPDHRAGREILNGQWKTLRAVLVAPDAERLDTLRAETTSRSVGTDEAEAIVARFDPPAPAFDLLIARVPRADQLGLLIRTCAAQTFDDDRLPLLDGRADLLATADLDAAGRLLDAFAFEAGKQEALLRLMDAAPTERRPKLLRLGIEKLTFDDQRFLLLDARPEVTRALSDADRDAVIAAFSFEREKAAEKLRR
jgi:hypothetical protein